jgi:hypothetical protein
MKWLILLIEVSLNLMNEQQKGVHYVKDNSRCN